MTRSYKYYICAALILVIGLTARWKNLDLPPYIVFDEAHYVRCARAFIEGRNFFNDHPAFGKLLIGVGMIFFGDNPFGWRVVPCVFGSLLLIVAPAICHLFYRSWAATLLCAGFFAIDGLFIAYSRTALMDGMMIFFALFGILLAKIGESKSALYAFCAGASVGLAGAMKVNGLWALAPICLIYIFQARFIPQFLAIVGSVTAYCSSAVLAYKIMGAFKPITDAMNWQRDSLSFHTSILAPHQFSSDWYTWFIMVKPVLLHVRNSDPPGITVAAIANPLLLWGTTLFIAVLAWSVFQSLLGLAPLIKMRSRNLLVLMIAYLSNLVPWMIISRPSFFYHYIPSYAVAIIAVCGMTPYFYQKNRYITYLFVTTIIIGGLYFLPLSTASELSRSGLQSRSWLECWFKMCRWAP